ncbi:MAG: S8 family serine peptidase, partial [Chloroflexota bacterium]
MDRRRIALTAGLVVALIASLAPVGTSARGAEARFDRPDGKVRKARIAQLPSQVGKNRMTMVFVELKGRPVAAYVGAAEASGTTLSRERKVAIRQSLGRQQSAVRTAIVRAGGRIRADFTDVLNGYRVEIRGRSIPALGRIPGVQAVHRVPRHVPDNTNVVLETGAAATWARTGFTGEGVRIAIIDSGINFYHKTFAGAGLAPWEADDGLTQNEYFPNEKVVGGWDFVGDAYDAGDETPVIAPDPNPLDCKDIDSEVGQHGTHVAGTAAGFGVTDAGDAYTGPYTANAIRDADLRIGPGTAPNASILAYRIFGCSGSTFFTLDAIERAVRDGADVINMSLGSNFGSPGTVDALASDNAVLAGVVVVASAGNSAASAYITGSPGSSTRTLTVAASDGNPSFPGARILLDSGGPVRAINANDADLPVTGELNVFEDDPTTTGDEETGAGFENLGCDADAYTYNGFSAGQIAVVERGSCARTDKAAVGDDEGAAAVIMVNTGTTFPPFEGPIYSVGIPFIGVPSSAGTDLAANDGTDATIEGAGGVSNPTYREIASFSSRGPGRVTQLVKPDVAAPGVTVVSAFGATVGQGVGYSGTSMAAPAAAGIVALVREARPEWGPRAVKAAIVGTAAAGRIEGYTIRSAGAGLVQPLRAVATDVYAVTAAGTASLTFGAVDGKRDPSGTTAFRRSARFRLVNTSDRPLTYTLTNDFRTATYGVSASISPSVVTLPARSGRDIRVSIRMSETGARDLPNASGQHGPNVDVDASGLYFMPIATVAGTIVARPTVDRPGAETIGIPWHVVPRGTSDIAPVPSSRSGWSIPDPLYASTIRVTNRGVHKGFVDTYALGLEDGRDDFGAVDLRAGGVQSIPAGVCTGEDDPDDRCIVFALNVWERWDTPAAFELDVLVDLDADGTEDVIIAALDLGLLGLDEGVLGAVAFDAVTLDVYAVWFAAGGTNGSTVLLPILASELGLSSGGDEAFRYWANAWTIYDDDGTGLFVDVMDTGQREQTEAYGAHVNVFDPVLSQGDFRPLKPGASTTIELTLDPTRYDPIERAHKGWLVVSLDDAYGADQADIIPVGELTPFNSRLGAPGSPRDPGPGRGRGMSGAWP